MSAGVKTLFIFNGLEYLNDLVDLFFDNAISFKNENNKLINKEDILYDYIKKINRENDHILVLDNFNICDYDSFELILPLIRKLQKNSCIKIFMVITDNVSSNDIICKIYEKLNFKSLILKKFPSYKEFLKILNKNVIIYESDNAIIKELYEYCHGNPQNLIIFLTKYFIDKEYSTTSSNQICIADIAKFLANKKLQPNAKLSNFNIVESLILFILCNITTFIEQEKLIFIIEKILKIEKNIILENIYELRNKNIIIYNYDYLPKIKFSFTHDSIYYLIQDYLLTDPNIKLITSSWANNLFKLLNENQFGFNNEKFVKFLLDYQ